MPMYEYRCQQCGRLFEQLRRMSEADDALECPHCGSVEVSRQISACAVGGASAAPSCVPRGGFS